MQSMTYKLCRWTLRRFPAKARYYEQATNEQRLARFVRAVVVVGAQSAPID